MNPSNQPTGQPTTLPSSQPSWRPSSQPSGQPSVVPTAGPSGGSTGQPTGSPSNQPSGQPTAQPSGQPTRVPSGEPTEQPSSQPSGQPTTIPTSQPSSQPTTQPTEQPTGHPTGQPSRQPTDQPSAQPTGQPTSRPSMQPTTQPTGQPTSQPTSQPTDQPTEQPTGQPSIRPSSQPSVQPSVQPTSQPSVQPTVQPSSQPTSQPTTQPSDQPSSQPTSQPSAQPSMQPTAQPSSQPSTQPSGQPTVQPSMQPTGQPTSQPSSQPTSQPSSQPTAQPSAQPSGQPSSQPTSQPSGQPSNQPTVQPTNQPSSQPTTQPTNQPTAQPTSHPSNQPSSQPTSQPTRQPTEQPSVQPTGQPTSQPTGQPTVQPSVQPSAQPTVQPSVQPTGQPTSQPSSQSTSQPTGQPTVQPSVQPSSQPTVQPSDQPTTRPTAIPTPVPTTTPTITPTKVPSFYSPVNFTQQCIVSNNTVTVRYTVARAASIYCAAFEGSDYPVIHTVRAISSRMNDYNARAAHSYIDSGRFDFFNLEGKSAYQILCYTESVLRQPDVVTTTPLDDVRAVSCSVMTTGSRVISLTVDDGVIVAENQTLAVNVGITSPPLSPVSFSVLVLWASLDSLGECVSVEESDYVSATTALEVFPSVISYTSSLLDLNRQFHIKSSVPGCLSISLTTSDESSSVWGDYVLSSVSTPKDVKDLNLMPLGSSVLVATVYSAEDFASKCVTIESAVFGSSASTLVVTLSSSSDYGQVVVGGFNPQNFNCNTLLLFAGSDASSCAFTARNEITVTFPSLSSVSTQLPVPGDVVHLIPGILGSANSLSVCSSSLSSNTTVLEPVKELVPHPSVSGPAKVVSCEDVPVSLSATGSGGRDWVQVEWTVFSNSHPDNTRQTSIEAYMNSLNWFGPYKGRGDSDGNMAFAGHYISKSYFTIGVYSFLVRVTNFLGKTGFDSFTLHVTSDNDVPMVRMLGSSRREMFRDQQLTLYVQAHPVMCSSAGVLTSTNTAGLLYSWMMLKNDVPYTDLGSFSNGRVFTLPVGTLLQGNEYSVVATVTDSHSGASVSSETKIYVNIDDMSSVITGGSYQTHYTGKDVIFNTTVSGSQGIDGETSSLSYRWHCTSLSPLLTDCGIADPSISLDAPVLSLPANTLPPSRLYRFDVMVVQAASGRSSWSSVVVHLTSDPVPLVSLPSALPNIDSKSNLTTSISVSSAINVVSNVTITGIDTDVSHPGGYFTTRTFPVQLAGSVLTGGGSFTLELRVTPLECISFSSSCTTSSAVFQTEITTNQPPSGGSFDIQTMNMSDERVFFFQANGWTDMDYPLRYAFLRLSVGDTSDEEESLLQQHSELDAALMPLAAGDVSQAYEVTFRLLVTDMYDSYAVSELSHTVPSTTVLSSDTVHTKARLAMSRNDTDGLLQWSNYMVLSMIDMQCTESALVTSECMSYVAVASSTSLFLMSSVIRDKYLLNTLSYYLTIYTAVTQAYVSSSTELVHQSYSDVLINLLQLLQSMSEAIGSDSNDNIGINLFISLDTFADPLIVSEYVAAASQNILARRLAISSNNNTVTSDEAQVNVFLESIAARTAHSVYDSLVFGHSTSLDLHYFSVQIQKSFFSINSTDTNNDGSLISIVNHTIFSSINTLAEVNAVGSVAVVSRLNTPSICTNENLTCEKSSDEMYVQLYLSSNTPITGLVDLQFAHTDQVEVSDKLTTVTSVSKNKQCSAPGVTLDFACTVSETQGYDFSVVKTCLNTSENEVGAWEVQCPVYEVVPSCGTFGNENNECIAERIGLDTICICPVLFVATDEEYLTGQDAFGYRTYGISQIISNVALLAAEETQPAEETWTPFQVAQAFASAAKAQTNDLPLRLSLGLAVPFVFIAMALGYSRHLSLKYKNEVLDAWKAVNTGLTPPLYSEIVHDIPMPKVTVQEDSSSEGWSQTSSDLPFQRQSSMTLKTEGIRLGRGRGSQELNDLEVGFFEEASEVSHLDSSSSSCATSVVNEMTAPVEQETQEAFTIPIEGGVLDLRMLSFKTL